MDRFRWGALASLAASGALMAYAVTTGQARVGLFLIVPFLIGTGPAALGAMVLLFLAFVLWAIGSARRARAEWSPPTDAPPETVEPKKARSGGVVLIGPIPIVWGSDRRILPWMVAAGLLLLVLSLWLSR